MKVLPTLLLLLSTVLSVPAAVYYVDASKGDDAASGTAPKDAWRSLDRVNGADIRPGDRVLFKRGEVWRGQLLSKSGEPGRPVCYGAYGKGPKPEFWGSVDRSQPSDWVSEGIDIWATRPCVSHVGKALFDVTKGRWWASCEKGVQGGAAWAQEGGTNFWRISCSKKPAGAARNHLQLIGPAFPDVWEMPMALEFTFRMRASKPIRLTDKVMVMQAGQPWGVGYAGALSEADSAVGSEWKEVRVRLAQASAHIRPLAFRLYLGSDIVEGCDFDFLPVSLKTVECDPATFIGRDIGNFICDFGEHWGVKRWSLDELRYELDYWYDAATDRVFVRCDRNPAAKFGSIELAKTWVVIPHGGRHDVIWEALTVRYTGGFAFAGGASFNNVVRNCDLCWIGGGLQYFGTNAKGQRYPVRYGNGIEWWSPAWSNTVERCRIWQVYDAALTPQTSRSPNPIHDIVMRDNVIWQSEYSLEYWNGATNSYTANITFEHNTCVDAGYAWSHAQRPDPNGGHVMVYSNRAPCTNIVIRNNLFCRTTERAVRTGTDWRYGADFDYNLYWVPSGSVFRYYADDLRLSREEFAARANEFHMLSGESEFNRYREVWRMDPHSLYVEPDFIDEEMRDYRLKPGSPGVAAASDGGPVGARNMPGLDQDQSVPIR